MWALSGTRGSQTLSHLGLYRETVSNNKENERQRKGGVLLWEMVVGCRPLLKTTFEVELKNQKPNNEKLGEGHL